MHVQHKPGKKFGRRPLHRVPAPRHAAKAAMYADMAIFIKVKILGKMYGRCETYRQATDNTELRRTSMTV